jgi:UDP-N-acetylmuramoylalanine--D-glutamate ligase
LRHNGRERIIDQVDPLLHTSDRQNLMAAALAAIAGGASFNAIKKAMRNRATVPHRFELVATKRNVQYINDSAATAPDAAVAGIERVHGPLILLAGGTDKNLPYRRLTQAMNKRRPKQVILFRGTATEKIVQSGLRRPFQVVDTMLQAVSEAAKHSVPGDTVLLSPGAASFGLFKHEFDRGEQFRRAVQRIKS